MSQKLFSPVRSDVSFPKQEEEILQFWDQQDIFNKTLKQSSEQIQKAKSYSFYDGPPFATGLPHYGHLLAGTLKDIVPRYWTMRGYHVERRFGWDCHGLPVEYEINKAHKIESNKQILEMGIDKYNSACRSIVQRYSEEWKRTVKRTGRWVDMENAYFTMDPGFMSSVWWVFKTLYDKGLVYEGYKVVPYSTGVSTALSNFEANLNYKEVQDPAITVSFPIEKLTANSPFVTKDKTIEILAWTTTPWTLPSNMGLAFGKEISYAEVLEVATERVFVIAEALVKNYWKKEGEVQILSTFLGEKMVGLTYTPLFDFFQKKKSEGAFQVILADHVTTESGTGVVHMAPAFGEEDYLACKKYGVPLVNPVDDDGMFLSEVTTYQGQRVKEADKQIIADLKKSGRLYKQETIMHSYPYCWRSDTPLIYRAVSSWYVAVEKIKDDVIAANQKTSWVPDHLRDGRFGKWLENARDWAISRNRFWGTPIPIWKNKEGERICIGSREELEKLSGKKVDDLHMEFVDLIEIPSPTGKSPLRRVSEVLDCWFESGSMPYAQWYYPQKNQEAFEKNFPADFIAEGLDQTRGWFYTLMVIGAALFQEAPFRNVIVNGLILAEDGKKMSKSLRNYPDPNELLNRQGADALRLYLIDSPVVKAQELRFSENGVRDIVRRVLLRWWNAYSFFVNYANIDNFEPKGDSEKSPNLLDQWILSRLHGLIRTTEIEMSAYRLYNVVPALLQFVEDLTNSYIRFNRPHFWQEGMPEDKRFAYETLYKVLLELSKVMAPFAPFISEAIYLNLAKAIPGQRKESVHLESYPQAEEKRIRPDLEEAVQVMDTLVMLGRNYREKIGVKAKIPLLSMKIIHRSSELLKNLKRFEAYFQEELNIRKIDYVSDEDNYVQVSAKANFPALGKRLGPKMKGVAAGIQKLGLSEILKLEKGESVLVEDEEIFLGDVEIRRAPKGDRPHLVTHQWVSIDTDPTVTEDQTLEGLAREVMRKIQAARKNADFKLDDRIRVELKVHGALEKAVQKHQDRIAKEVLARELQLVGDPQGTHVETVDLDEGPIVIGVRVL